MRTAPSTTPRPPHPQCTPVNGLAKRWHVTVASSAREDAGVEINRHQLMLKRMAEERKARVRQLEGQGLTHGQALYAADHGGALPSGAAPGAPAMPRTGGAGSTAAARAGVSVSIGQLTVGGGAPHEIRKQFHEVADQLADHTIAKLQRRMKNGQRTSYSDGAPFIPGLSHR